MHIGRVEWAPSHLPTDLEKLLFKVQEEEPQARKKKGKERDNYDLIIA